MLSDNAIQTPAKMVFLASISALVILAGLAMPFLAYTIAENQAAMGYVLGIYLGLFVIGQWVSHEAKSIDMQLQMQLFNIPADAKMDFLRTIIFAAPTNTLFCALIAFVVLL